MSAFELQLGHGVDPVAAYMAEVQLGHLFGTEFDPGAGAVVVSVAGSMPVSSWSHETVEELVSVIDLGSHWFGTWSSVVADCLW